MKYLIVGLGNVGAEYEGTRHNSGFMVLDRLLKACSREGGEKPAYVLDRHAYRAEVRLKGRTLVLIRPTTYMNLSGKAVQYWLQKEKVGVENLLVIVDDIALPVGKIRMKKQGSHGGHNGLANIEELIHTANYCRLRIGVGNNTGPPDRLCAGAFQRGGTGPARARTRQGCGGCQGLCHPRPRQGYEYVQLMDYGKSGF